MALRERLDAEVARLGSLQFVMETAARLRADLAANWRNGLSPEQRSAATRVLADLLEELWGRHADPTSCSVVDVHTISASDARPATLSVAVLLAAGGRRARLAADRHDSAPFDGGGADAVVVVVDTECDRDLARERIVALAATSRRRPVIVCGDAGRIRLSDVRGVTRISDLESLLSWATLTTTAAA